MRPARSASAASDELLRETSDVEASIEIRGEARWVRPVPYLPRLYLRAVGAAPETLAPSGTATSSIALEKERGYDAAEDLWSPLAWTGTLAPGGEAYPALLPARRSPPTPGTSSRRSAAAGTRSRARATRCSTRWRGARKPSSSEGDYRDGTILAGFPWFADWGRDSMIAAPGLALATGRFGAVARVLNTYAALRRDGLLPNNFAGEQGEPEYGSIDAPLWFVLAVEWFARARRNASRPAPLLAAVRSILAGLSPGNAIRHRRRADGLALSRRRPAAR